MFTMFIQVCWKTEKSPPCRSGFSIRVGRGIDFLRQNWKYACLSAKIFNIFCQIFGNLLVNYGRNPIFIHYSAFFPTENRIITIFMNIIPPTVDQFSILCSVSPGKPCETLSAKFSDFLPNCHPLPP
jgi:hypothetical protein